MTKKPLGIMLVIVVLLVALGCGGSKVDQGVVKGNKGAVKSRADKDIPAKNRPKTKTDTILINGEDKKFEFALFDDETVRFSTYIAEDMIGERGMAENGGRIFVFAKDKDKKDINSSIEITVKKKDAKNTVDYSVKAVKELVQTHGFKVIEHRAGTPEQYNIPGARSKVEFAIKKQNAFRAEITGTGIVFERGGYIYRIIIQYPLDRENEFKPRVDKMLSDIMFYDEKN
ncbi:MAG: hypothetical protein K6T91_03445 [Firmicutes bacterium]|nr:hypothetical protein [Bacillota bacterium]